LVAYVIGCGGSSATTAPSNKTGTASAKIVTTEGQATDYKVKLDGVEVSVPIGSDGSFTIPGIPPGSHVLDVIGPDGMHGGRAEFVIDPGEVKELPPIPVEPCGQIAGMVMKRDGDTLTPLAGVEVVARSDLIWIMAGDGKTTVGSTDPSGGTGLVFPPPEGKSYSAFTDSNGSYVMPAVKPGSYLVTVVVPGLVPGEQFVSVEPGKTAVADFELEEAVEPGVGTVEGTVYGLDEKGENPTPLEGALVQVSVGTPWRPPRPEPPIIVPLEVKLPGVTPAEADDGSGLEVMPPDLWWQVFSTLTDANGHYSLNVPAGRATITANAWGYTMARQSLVIARNTTTTVDLKLTKLPIVIEPPTEGTRPGK